MKGSFEKFHDWLYKWFFEHNEKVQGVKLKYDLPMDPKQQVWTTVKENEGGSKTRSKLKVTKNKANIAINGMTVNMKQVQQQQVPQL